MELKDLKLKTEKELKQILNEFRDKLRDLRFKDANKQLKDVREIRGTKKTIARVLTLLSKAKAGAANTALADKNKELKS